MQQIDAAMTAKAHSNGWLQRQDLCSNRQKKGGARGGARGWQRLAVNAMTPAMGQQ